MMCGFTFVCAGCERHYTYIDRYVILDTGYTLMQTYPARERERMTDA